MTVPEIRVRECNSAPVNGNGEFVLYWMIAYRRTTWNFSLQRAVDWARKLNRPLVLLEALRCDYPWASIASALIPAHRRYLPSILGMRESRARPPRTGP